MTNSNIDQDLLEQLRRLSETSAVPLAEQSMDDIAGALGMARMTLYRKAGTRDQIVGALERIGVDARRQPDVFERVVAATVELLGEYPITELTLELIAGRASCSVPAIHARFGGRQGVIRAVIERHSPLLPVKEAVTHQMGGGTHDLQHDIRLLYRTLFGHLEREWPVLRSFIAEVLGGAGTDVRSALRQWYLPQAQAVIVPFILKHIEQGTIRPLPVPIVVQMLVAPMGLHVASRQLVTNELGFALPDPDTTVDLFTEMFCRAVGTEISP